MSTKTKFYSTKQIDDTKAEYRLILGERSNGKSYALKVKALENYADHGGRTVWIRRYEKEILKKNIFDMFSSLYDNGEFERIFKGKWENVVLKNGGFYLCRYDEEEQKWIDDFQPFMKIVCVADSEHERDKSFTDLDMIVYDEFVTRGYYLYGEFVRFVNILSTYIRERNDVIVYMLGNTVSKNCPYFAEMGLHRVFTQKQGTIDVYTLNRVINDEEIKTTIAVEIVANKGSKKSDKYFAFDNPRMKMITSGEWELEIYPHLPFHYERYDVVGVFCIVIQNKTLQCDCVCNEDGKYIFVHEKTTPIKENTLTYGKSMPVTKYSHRTLFKPLTAFQRAIVNCIKSERIYYQDNTIGELFNDYVKECRNY